MTRSALRTGAGLIALALVAAAGALTLGDVGRSAPAPATASEGAQPGEVRRQAESKRPLSASEARGMGPGVETDESGRVVLGHQLLTPEQRELAVIGGKSSPDVAFCSDDNWRSMRAGIAEIADRQLIVDPADWERRDTGGRLGLARWASTCLFEGQAIHILDAATRASLARYSRERGFRPAS